MAATYADIDFVATDADELLAEMVEAYESATGLALSKADPMMLNIDWVASVIVQAREQINQAAKMNVPRYAKGEYLDSLGELFRNVTRLPGDRATATICFTLSEAPAAALTIPAGTRVATNDDAYIFATDQALTIPAGSTQGTVAATCQEAGTGPNAYGAGTICKLVDVFPLYASCENVTAAAGGTARETDAELYERYRISTDTWSTAGSTGSYEYFAKSAVDGLGDVHVIADKVYFGKDLEPVTTSDSDRLIYLGGPNVLVDTIAITETESPYTAYEDYTVQQDDTLTWVLLTSGGDTDSAAEFRCQWAENASGVVRVYLLGEDGESATDDQVAAVKDALDQDTVRPVTDSVHVQAAAANYPFSIDLSYAIAESNAADAANIQAAVEQAVADYALWQVSKIGRNINPDYLRQLVLEAGAYKVTVNDPEYTVVHETGCCQLSGNPAIAYEGIVEDE